MRMGRIGRTAGWAAAVMGVSLIAAAQESESGLDLRAVWKAGQASEYRITQTELTTTKASFIPEAQTVGMKFTVDVGWEVMEAAEGGGGRAKMTTKGVEVEIDTPDGRTLRATASGGDAEAEAYQKWAAAMSGSSVEFGVAADGSIESVSGGDAVRAGADPEVAEGLDDDYFKNIAMELATLTGGKESVKVGDTWTGSHESGHQFGELTYQTTYRLEGIEKIAGVDVALVGTTSAVTLTPEVPELPAGAAPPTIALTGSEVSGQLLFDLTRHELVGGHSRQNLEVTVTVTRPDGVEMSIVTTEATKVKLLRTGER